MKRTATITVPLPPEQATTLFTPEGERGWAPGWNPRHHSDTVFTTDHAGSQTTWVVLDAGENAVRYARVTPDRHAGTAARTARRRKPRSPTTSPRSAPMRWTISPRASTPCSRSGNG